MEHRRLGRQTIGAHNRHYVRFRSLGDLQIDVSEIVQCLGDSKMRFHALGVAERQEHLDHCCSGVPVEEELEASVGGDWRAVTVGDYNHP